MKHTLRTIIWVIAMTLGVCASAQTDTKRAFRMYMHDGSVQFFFYSDIQSMTVGYEDGDMERPVQIINTPDSVYTFAMADIDSVSFARPVTEYKSNVVRLEDGLRSYLTASDSLKLTFRSDVPRNLFPTVGGYLVTLECDELLPGGFIGKLASVREEGEGVVALCDKAAATDVFEKLFIAVGEKTDETGNQSGLQRAPEDPRVWNGYIDVPPIGYTHNLDFGVVTGMFSGGYSQSSSFEVSTQSFHVRTFLLIENMEINFSMLCKGEHTLNLQVSVGIADSFSKEFRRVKIPIRVPYAIIPSGSWDLGFYINAGAGVGINHQFNVPFTSVTYFSFGRRWFPVLGFVPVIKDIPNSCNIRMANPNFELDVEGNASAEFGVYGSANIYPAVEEISKLSAGLRTGLKISSQVSWLPTVGPIDKVNTEMYDELNHDDFFRLDWLHTGFVSLESKLFNFNISNEIQWNATRKNPIWTGGVVPEFYDVKLTESNIKGALNAAVSLRRKLAFNTSVGLGLYDNDAKLVDSWWYDDKYKDQEGLTITHNFGNLKTGGNYILHPIVHALNGNMVANPSAKCQLGSRITTLAATKIGDTDADLMAQIMLDGDLTKYQAGFYYYETNGEKKQVVTEGCGSQNLRISIDGLKPNTTYSYYAFLKVGDYVEYGDVLEFKTNKVQNEISANIEEYVADITSSSIVLSLKINVPDGYSHMHDIYFYEEGGETQIKTYSTQVSNSRTLGLRVSNLKDDTKYYFYAAVKTNNNVVYSNTACFRTLRKDDSENPVFEFKPIRQISFFDRIQANYQLVKKGEIDASGYNVARKCLVLHDDKGTKATNDGFTEELQLMHSWRCDETQEGDRYVNFDFDLQRASGSAIGLVKYSLIESPDDWYYTKVPLQLLYENKAKLLSIKGSTWSNGYGFIITVDGALWFSSLNVTAELWRSETYYEDGIQKTKKYKIEEGSFEFDASKNIWNSFKDGQNSIIIWPGTTDRNNYVVIKNVFAKLKNGEFLNLSSD